MSGVALFGSPVRSVETADELLELNPEMSAFISKLKAEGGTEARWEALVDHFNSDQFAVEYDAMTTLSAAETFETRSGNCLAVTLLLVSLSRELGIDTYFNQVETPLVWSFEDKQTVVNFRHINMAANLQHGRKVVDFGVLEYTPTMYQYQITDRAAFSQYFSNRAMEVMQEGGDLIYAFQLIQKALKLAPGDSNIWLNLGAMYKRGGKIVEAEQSYKLAHQLDDTNIYVVQSLERLYLEAGDHSKAAHYTNRAQELRESTPQFLYYQAKRLYERGDYRESKSKLVRALRENRGDHRVQFLLGKTLFQMGEYERATGHLKKAFALQDDPDIKHAYQTELSELRR
ncbi:tetratricopeptide repeat protein [Microbulbifer agarilyticus]